MFSAICGILFVAGTTVDGSYNKFSFALIYKLLCKPYNQCNVFFNEEKYCYNDSRMNISSAIALSWSCQYVNYNLVASFVKVVQYI